MSYVTDFSLEFVVFGSILYFQTVTLIIRWPSFLFILQQVYHLMELKVLRPLLRIRDPINDINPMNLLSIMDMPEDSSFFSSDNFRLVIVCACSIGYIDHILKPCPHFFHFLF